MKYLPRVVDKEIDELMQIMGAVLIEGCKWCGKSTTGLFHSKSVIEFQNPDKKQEYDDIKNTKPSLFLVGEKPRMFDEWQMYPVVWDSIRTDVDHTRLKGQYILTGSAKPSEGETMHTGTGRISRVLMRPMSLYESSESNDDMDLDVLRNLLQSYTSQPSMDGPVQNILTSMGMAIPPSKEKTPPVQGRNTSRYHLVSLIVHSYFDNGLFPVTSNYSK